MMNNIYLFILLFIMVISNFFALLYLRRKQQGKSSLDEYFIANRNLTGFSIAMTTAATFASASSFIGGVGAAYSYGLSWVLVAMTQVPGIWFVFGVIGKRMAYLANKYNTITINDILYKKYKSKKLVTITSLSLIVSFIVAMVVQFIGGARLLEGYLNINYIVALLIFSFIIGSYTLVGGFRAVVYTDIIQGLVMLVGSIVLLVMTIYKAGGLNIIVSTVEPELLHINGGGKITGYLFTYLWITLCFALIGLPQILLRSTVYNHSKHISNAIIISTIVITIIMFSLHFSGFIANIILGKGIIADLVMPTLINMVLPVSISFILLIVPLFAILSTVDSLLIQSSASIVNDLCLNCIPENKINFFKSKMKLISRIVSFVILIIVFLLSLNPPSMIVWLNLYAFGGLQVTFMWVILFALFYSKANKYGALSSIISGLGSYLIFVFFKISILNFHPLIPALIIGLISFIIGNYLGIKRSFIR